MKIDNLNTVAWNRFRKMMKFQRLAIMSYCVSCNRTLVVCDSNQYIARDLSCEHQEDATSGVFSYSERQNKNWKER
jgi:hypothetical protein